MKLSLSLLGRLGVAFFLGGCASSTSSDPAAATESDFTSGDAPASHCEVYVERAAPSFSSHGSELLTLYLKTPLGKLDGRGGVKAVGLHAAEIVDGVRGPFKDIAASSFANSADYWQLVFDIQNDFRAPRTYVGAFYVEAKDGSRLWVNATTDDKNFTLDNRMVQNLANRRPAGFFASSSNAGPNAAIVAADEFPFLNPQACR